MAEAISERRAAAPWVEALWRFFRCKGLTATCIFVLLLAAAASALLDPTAIPQIAAALELYAPFRSWWLTLALVVLWLNLLALGIERLPRGWVDRAAQVQVQGRGQLDSIEGALGRRGYRLRRTALGIVAERGQASRLGAAVASVSMLAILGGAIFGRLAGFEATALLQPGTESDIVEVRSSDGAEVRRKLGFLIRCDDARGGRLDVRLFERLGDGGAGRQLARDSLSARHALRYGALTLRYGGLERIGAAGNSAARLEVTRDPALPVELACALLFVAGAAAMLSTSHRRIWAREDRGTLYLAGMASRRVGAFRQELDAVCAELALAPAPRIGASQ